MTELDRGRVECYRRVMSFRSYFEFDPNFIHLNNAGACPPPKKTCEAVSERMRQQSLLGAHSVSQIIQDLTDARKTLATFVGTVPDHVAFTSGLSSAVSNAAWGLPFRSGDQILTIDQEYPSNVYVWRTVAKEKNLRIQVFLSNPDTSINWDQFINQIKPGVRAVVISWVQYLSGVTAPLKQISEACRRVGAWLIVDAIQGLGAIPFDLSSTGVDIVCMGSHKWICAFPGQGFMAFKDELYLEMQPHIQGAMTFGTPMELTKETPEPVSRAARFEPGAPSHLGIWAMATSIGLIQEYGIEKIRTHNLTLRKRLSEGLSELGMTLLGDPQSDQTSSIVAFKTKGNIQALTEKLAQEKISHVMRIESIRLSPHAFNTEAEIEKTLSVLRST